MTEEEANNNLEKAINDWLTSSGYSQENDVVTGWVLLSEVVDMSDTDLTTVLLTTSDHLSVARQLGIIDYAQTIVRAAIARTD